MRMPHDITVERLQTEGNHQEAYQEIGVFKGFIQPLEVTDNNGVVQQMLTKQSRCYAPLETDFKVNDRLRWSGKTYSVTGIREHNYGSFPHQMLMLEER